MFLICRLCAVLYMPGTVCLYQRNLRNPMNRSPSTRNHVFFLFRIAFSQASFAASLAQRREAKWAGSGAKPQLATSRPAGTLRLNGPNSYSCSPQPGGTSNCIRPKGPILCDVIFAKGELTFHDDQDPFACPVFPSIPYAAFQAPVLKQCFVE